MRHRSNRGRGNRLVNHGAGKGDADRTSDAEAYAANLSEINFPNSDEGFEVSKNGKRKIKYYGTRAPKPERMEFVPIPPLEAILPELPSWTEPPRPGHGE